MSKEIGIIEKHVSPLKLSKIMFAYLLVLFTEGQGNGLLCTPSVVV